MQDAAAEYTKGFKFIHWFIALLVILMLGAGFFLDDLPEEYMGTAYMMHKSIGLTILFLMIFRLIWVSYKGRIPLPESVPAWERVFSRVVQYSLYLFLILMPLSGWIMSVAAQRTPSYFGLLSLPLPWVKPDKQLAHFMEDVHGIIAWVLIGLIVLHIAGALKHHFYDKDSVLQSMLPRPKMPRQRQNIKNF
ncbi:cytochrome b [Legionella hackeliae]|uniref:CybB cytochrome b-561 transmembrane protein n=1 Tax=Legionella hackeliae TaxID=449 RepID=A0A0A8UT07_LEGHA|nr:cytochrome b [Legionella hackeliae]KTD13898.1 cytochrome b-561 transmembrane protein [Legionella hackeliae]CEK10601.1 CybB cytochrome b-561 transmembrane protein [Legionella hackeliae]STX47344.1 cybB cytochrome b-561 transmembrane protein [Legionella hackeliae]